jgi:predicted Zn-dependent peptidase
MEKRYSSESGVEVLAYKNPSLHGFYISLFLRAGSMYENESERGITHFLEHALVRNVNKRHSYKLYSELDKLGMEFNASTYSEMVQFYLFGESGKFKIGADIITEILAPITLTRDETETECRRIKAEIRESDEKSSLAAFTAERVFSGTTLSGTIIGTAGSVGKITAKRLE